MSSAPRCVTGLGDSTALTSGLSASSDLTTQMQNVHESSSSRGENRTPQESRHGVDAHDTYEIRLNTAHFGL